MPNSANERIDTTFVNKPSIPSNSIGKYSVNCLRTKIDNNEINTKDNIEYELLRKTLKILIITSAIFLKTTNF